MTNVSWTPGPWRRGGLHISAFVIVPQGTETHPVADVYGEANARLIAEAPAMAEALEQIEQMIDYGQYAAAQRIIETILARIKGATP